MHQPGGCPYVVPLARARTTVQTLDLRAEKGYLEKDPFYVTAVDTGGARTALRVPLLKGNTVLGHLWAFRQEVKAFTHKQIDLIGNFTKQAVIAIENARLFEAEQARTRELQQLLEYQTATSEILNVISRFASQIRPVLGIIVETAGRPCDGYDTLLLLQEGESLKPAAHAGSIDIRFENKPVARSWVTGPAVVDRKFVHVHDFAAVADEFPDSQPMNLPLGVRTLLAIPLDAIVESAAGLCGAVFSVVWRYDGDLLHDAASHNFTPEVLAHIFEKYPKQPDRSVAAGRAVLDRSIAHAVLQPRFLNGAGAGSRPLPSEEMTMRKLRFLPVLVLAALLSGFGGETLPLGVAQAEAAPRVSEAGAAAALISRYRAAYGLGPVKVDARLNAAAEHQARAVAQAGSLSHGDFAARIAAFGIRGQAAENLSAGVRSVEEAIAQWQGSSGHNANLLLPQVTRIGLARADGGGYGRYWALVLAR